MGLDQGYSDPTVYVSITVNDLVCMVSNEGRKHPEAFLSYSPMHSSLLPHTLLESLCMGVSSRCELLDALTTSWESFQIGRTLSLSPNDHKPRPTEESMEPISCCSGREICGSRLECVGL